MKNLSTAIIVATLILATIMSFTQVNAHVAMRNFANGASPITVRQGDYVSFQSPSTNIYCEASDTGVSCMRFQSNQGKDDCAYVLDSHNKKAE